MSVINGLLARRHKEEEIAKSGLSEDGQTDRPTNRRMISLLRTSKYTSCLQIWEIEGAVRSWRVTEAPRKEEWKKEKTFSRCVLLLPSDYCMHPPGLRKQSRFSQAWPHLQRLNLDFGQSKNFTECLKLDGPSYSLLIPTKDLYTKMISPRENHVTIFRSFCKFHSLRKSTAFF